LEKKNALKRGRKCCHYLGRQERGETEGGFINLKERKAYWGRGRKIYRRRKRGKFSAVCEKNVGSSEKNHISNNQQSKDMYSHSEGGLNDLTIRKKENAGPVGIA